MKLANLIISNDDHVAIVADIVETERKTKKESVTQEFRIYANKEYEHIEKTMYVHSTTLQEILSLIIILDSVRRSGMFEVKDDFVLIIPEFQRYVKLMPVELIQQIIESLPYVGVKLYCIASDEKIAEDYSFESVTVLA